MPVEFAHLSSFQLENLPRQKAVFFFPVGPLEDHGPHLPLGLDLEEAAQLCFVSAQHLEEELPGWVGVVMPRAALGIDSNTTRLTMTVRPHVLRDWLVDSCSSLMKAGFLHFVCFSGHLGPRQLTAIEDAAKIVRRKGRWSQIGRILKRLGEPTPSLIAASSLLVDGKHVLASPFWPDPVEHGGKRDTAIALAIRGDLVHSEYKNLPTLDRPISKWERTWRRRKGRLTGYWGNPAEATSELGEKEFMQSLEKVFLKMRAVWEGANPNFSFRSWYSILPPNKSFFRAWVLAAGACFVLFGWFLLMELSAIP